MKLIIPILFLISSTLLFSQGKYYISPTGNNTNLGTINSPWLTLQKAIDNLTTPGDTIFIRGGNYRSQIGNHYNAAEGHGVNGTYANPIVITGYPGEWPIFDCSDHCDNGATYNGFLSIDRSEHLKVRHMEIKNVFQCQYVNAGVIGSSFSRNLEFENLIIHDISTPRGYSMWGGAWMLHYLDPAYNFTIADLPIWPDGTDTTRFINCDVYNTCDTLGGGNGADGWKCVYYPGNYIEWENCRAWNYSDDGIDPNNVSGATFRIDGCWLMPTDKYERFDIEGNGIKSTSMVSNVSGKLDSYPFFSATNTIIADCEYTGFYDNLKIGNGVMPLNSYHFKNMSYKNNVGYLADNGTKYLNSAAYQNNKNFSTPTGYIGTGKYNTWNQSGVDSLSFNPWNYLSIDLGEIMWPRKADGSLPDVNLFKHRKGSPMIDAGTAIPVVNGINTRVDSAGFAAVTPDIGPWEYVEETGATLKEITSVTFPEQIGYSVYDKVNRTVHAKIRYMYRNQLSNLAPIILPSNRDTISPGFMVAQNFNNPVQYQVHQIGNPSVYETWTVTIEVGEPSINANMRSIWINNDVLADIDTVNNILHAFYRSGANVSNVSVAAVSFDIASTSNFSSYFPYNFNNGDLNFTITAENGRIDNWVMKVEEIKVTNTGGELGYKVVFGTVRTGTFSAWQGFPVGETGDIKSISIYHDGGSGNILVGVYDNANQSSAFYDERYYPRNRLAVSLPTALSATEGWQTVPLTSNASVTAGDTIYLAYVLEGNFSTRVMADQFNPIETKLSSWYYNSGLPAVAPTVGNYHFYSSIYANYDGVYASSDKNITSFSLAAQTKSATINATNHTVSIEVAFGTSRTSLSPTIGVSYAASISPASGTARNFTTPQIYTVTAEDLTTQTWTVTVTVTDEVVTPTEGTPVTSGVCYSQRNNN